MKAHRHPACACLALGLIAQLLVACATTGPDPAAGEWRRKLRQAMEEDVSTRDQRDAHSRLLVESVEHADLEKQNLADIQAEFGQGLSCADNSLCAEQGFSGDDLYFPIGRIADDRVKQLPVLIVGFDTHGKVKRVFSYQTH